jgi:photosystem II protein PsbQ
MPKSSLEIRAEVAKIIGLCICQPVMKAFLRPVLSVVLGLVATVLVACGGPNVAAPPPTYSQFQLDRIQEYSRSILQQHQRFEDLAAAIQAGNEPEAKAITNGPLGEMLRDMQSLNRNLLPKAQPAARELARALFDDFVGVDQALLVKNTAEANRAFAAAGADFERYINLLPETETPAAS